MELSETEEAEKGVHRVILEGFVKMNLLSLFQIQQVEVYEDRY